MINKEDEAQFHLRLPYEIHAKIKQRAKMNNRYQAAQSAEPRGNSFISIIKDRLRHAPVVQQQQTTIVTQQPQPQKKLHPSGWTNKLPMHLQSIAILEIS